MLLFILLLYFCHSCKFINSSKENIPIKHDHLTSMTFFCDYWWRCATKNIVITTLIATELAINCGGYFPSNQPLWKLLLHPWVLLTLCNNVGWFIYCWRWGVTVQLVVINMPLSPILALINLFHF